MALLLSGALLILGLGWAACGDAGDTEVESEGMVRHIDVAGDCWAIITPETRYEPTNLSDPFRVDSLAVRFRGYLLPEYSSFCAVGKGIRLTSIESVGS